MHSAFKHIARGEKGKALLCSKNHPAKIAHFLCIFLSPLILITSGSFQQMKFTLPVCVRYKLGLEQRPLSAACLLTSACLSYLCLAIHSHHEPSGTTDKHPITPWFFLEVKPHHSVSMWEWATLVFLSDWVTIVYDIKPSVTIPSLALHAYLSCIPTFKYRPLSVIENSAASARLPAGALPDHLHAIGFP